jgi:hypothetical protein
VSAREPRGAADSAGLRREPALAAPGAPDEPPEDVDFVLRRGKDMAGEGDARGWDGMA